MTDRKLRGVTYFSGGGLAETGLTDLVDFVGGVEFDQKIADWHRDVYPACDLRAEDVCIVDPSDWKGVDYFHASPSCRKASIANADRGETPEDRAAADAVCRGIRVMRPTVFTLENVGPYRAFDSYQAVKDTLTAEGYRMDEGVNNSADFGAPQTRKRLYLRAWLLAEPLPPPVRTHMERGKLTASASVGDMFADAPLLPWVGWYEALTHPRYGCDLIPTLPESRFADWQIKRLPSEFLETFLCDNLATCREATIPAVSEPMFSVTTTNSGRRPSNMPSVFLCGVQGEGGDLARVPERDAPALTATHGAGKYRAFVAHPTADTLPKAVLVEGDAAGDRCPTIRGGQEPSFTIKAAEGGRVHRAAMGTGRVVSLTTAALARFQMGVYAQGYPIPESRKLGCQIIGNGCQSEMHQALVAPLLSRILETTRTDKVTA